MVNIIIHSWENINHLNNVSSNLREISPPLDHLRTNPSKPLEEKIKNVGTCA
jgi:hypothetical protein